MKKMLMLVMCVSVLMLAGIGQAVVVTQYSFEGNTLDTASGGAIADDLTPGGNITYTSGVVGQAGQLNVTSLLSTSDSVDVSLTNSWAMELFLKIDVSVPSGFQRLILKWPDAGPYEYHMSLRDNKLDLQVSASMHPIDQKGSDLADGKWHHLAISNYALDSTAGLKGWVDGVLVHSSAGITLLDGTGNLTIGCGESNYSAFVGLVDGVRIHDDAVDQTYIDYRVLLLNNLYAPTSWIGTSSGDQLWSNPANWSDGHLPNGRKTILNNLNATHCIMDCTDSTAEFPLGDAGGSNRHYYVNVRPEGKLTVNSWCILGYSSSTGHLVIDGGQVETYGGTAVGFYGNGELVINSGIYIANGGFACGSEGSGHVQLNGGILKLLNGLTINTNGTIDVRGDAALIIAGDYETQFNIWIGTGLITSYGGDGDFIVKFDSNTNKTTLKANNTASVPLPTDGSFVHHEGITLQWTDGIGSLSHLPFFGSNFTNINSAQPEIGDYDLDSQIEIDDLLFLVEHWLASMDYLTVTDDHCDLQDMSRLSSQWLQTSPVFMGQTSDTSVTLDPLVPGTTYYWRIDELTASNIWQGETWNFTTIPTTAYKHYPADGYALYKNGSLSWLSGLDAVSHDIYFSADSLAVAVANRSSVGIYRMNTTDTTYTPSGLTENQIYYWRIDEVDTAGEIIPGEVLSFFAGADNTTLDEKIMCGYQMWFGTPEDPDTGGTYGFGHYGNSNGFQPGSCSIDYWPDTSEMDPDEKYLTTFVHDDGSPAYVYRSLHPKTVDRHFKWMRDYGISGVFIQKFGAAASVNGLVLARDIAPKYGRVFALMYDLSGQTTASLLDVKEDFKNIVDAHNILDSSAYIHHNGKPIVAVWGIGFNRPEYDAGMEDFLDFLKNDPVYGGNCVMVGVNNDWQTATSGSVTVKYLIENYCDIVSPWEVGRYGDDAGVEIKRQNYWDPDIAWCNANGKDYLPVNHPGFSWYNLQNGNAPLDSTKRRQGRFLWKQFYEAIDAGANMIYVAMFDEIDEGTAIFKCDPNPPVGNSPFLKYYDELGNSLPSDHYLWIPVKENECYVRKYLLLA